MTGSNRPKSVGGSTISSFGTVLNKSHRWFHDSNSKRHYLLRDGGPLHHPHQGARWTSVIPSVGRPTHALLRSSVARTDVKTRSVFIMFYSFFFLVCITLETSVVLSLTSATHRRQGEPARTSAECRGSHSAPL